MKSSGPYKYRGIEVHKGKTQQFRLFVLNPGSAQSDLRGSVTCYEMNQVAVKYEALSWTWGPDPDITDTTPHLTIVENSDGESKEFDLALRKNLHMALRRLRHPEKSRTLWIDFICIDQKNSAERNQQVQLMETIYKNAEIVFIWLGEHENGSELAFDFIHELNDLGQWEDLICDTQAQHKWEALAALMDRPWFSRRWIVQELSLAREATIQCADLTLDWSAFQTAVALFVEEAPKLEVLFGTTKAFHFDNQYLGDVGQIAASRLVRLRTDLFRLDSEGKITEYRRTLADLVTSLWAFAAKEPHDAIYSVLSLAKAIRSTVEDTIEAHAEVAADPSVSPAFETVTTKFPDDAEVRLTTDPSSGTEVTAIIPLDRHDAIVSKKVLGVFADRVETTAIQTFKIDYTQDFMVVCKQFLNVAFRTSKSYNLDILLRPWAPEPDPDKPPLPTWVRDVRHAAHGSYEIDSPSSKSRLRSGDPYSRKGGKAVSKTHWKRLNADPLVGEQEVTNRMYTASSVEKAAGWKCLFVGDSGLQVHGYVLDTISKIQDASVFGIIPKSWLKLGLKVDRTTKIIDKVLKNDPLWRTLVADRDPNGKDPPGHYSLSFEFCVKRSVTKNQALDAINTVTLCRRDHPILKEFLQRVTATVSNKRLFMSQRDNDYGLAPFEAQNGDHICIIDGMSVPVILRPLEDDDIDVSDDIPRYEIIGDCYLHTMMAGRAQETQKALLQRLTKEQQPDFDLISSHKMILL